MAPAKTEEGLSSYHPVEHFYLQYYLGLSFEPPEPFNWESIGSDYYESDQSPSPPFTLLASSWLQDEQAQVNNAVARLVLETTAERLPNFAVFNQSDGSVISARNSTDVIPRHRKVATLPTFLFEINWATSGPGFAWHESYHVGYVAEYDVHIVTASQDSNDVHGFCDICIGHFSGTEDFLNEALEVVKEWWGDKVAEYDADKYERLTQIGSATLEQVEEITTTVWGSADKAN